MFVVKNEELTAVLHFSTRAGACYVRQGKGSLNRDATSTIIAGNK
jgi:hypothetical protein